MSEKKNRIPLSEESLDAVAGGVTEEEKSRAYKEICGFYQKKYENGVITYDQYLKYKARIDQDFSFLVNLYLAGLYKPSLDMQ